jgi:glycosyltransferase involved in cell wall biosynthesis
MAEPRAPIVVAGPPMRTGGTEQHMLHVLPALAQRGFDITAVLLEAGGALEEPLRAGGIRIVTPARALKRPLRTLVQVGLIRRAVRETGAEVLHAYLSEPYLAATLAGVFAGTGRPALVYGRRSLAFYKDKQKLGAYAETWAHTRATVLLGNSTLVAAELSAESQLPARVALIHNGIPLLGAVSAVERTAARATFGLPDESLVLTMVANFHSYKGHGDLLAALGSIHHRLPQPWRMLLPGRDGGVLTDVGAQITTLGLAQNIVLPGEWPGSRAPYAAADIGLLTSHTEGFSNSVIEGMAAGLPMIVTAVGGNLDALEQDISGLLVQPHAPNELAAAILKLAQDAPMRARIGAEACARATTRFSLEACVDQYETLWRGLIDKRLGRPADWLSA